MRKLCIILLTWSWFLSTAQDPFNISYNIKDGLPSSEVYDVFQDSKGLIWLATDRGISVYDGYEFKTYTNKDGLTSNTNFKIYEDKNGIIYCTNVNTEINYFENDSFHLHPASTVAKEKNTVWGIERLFFVDNRMSFISLKSYLSPLYTLKNRTSSKEFIEAEFNSFDLNSKDKIDHKKQVINEINYRKNVLQLLESNQRDVVLNIKGKGVIPGACNQENNGIFFHIDNEVFYWNFNANKVSSTHFFKNKTIINLYYDRVYDDFWVITRNGVYRYPNLDLSQTPEHFFESVNCTNMIRDREGNYWLTVWDKGVLLIPSFNMKSITLPPTLSNVRVMALRQINHRLVLGTSNNGLGVIDTNGRIKVLLSNDAPDKKSQDISHIQETPTGFYATDGHDFIANQNMIKTSSQKDGVVFYSELSNGTRLIAARSPACSFVTIEGQEISTDYGRVYAALSANKDSFWLGTEKGLFLIQNSDVENAQPIYKSNPKVTGRITDIKKTPNGKIVAIGSQNHGLSLIYKGEFFHLEAKNSNYLINRLYFESNSILWLCTNKGLSKVKLNYNDLKRSEQYTFTRADGLLSNYVNDIVLWNRNYLIATNEGLNSINQSDLKLQTTAPIFSNLSMTLDNGIKVTNGGSYTSIDGIVEIKYNAVSFRRPQTAAFYKYQLNEDNQTKTWNSTNNRSVQLYGLLPNSYHLLIKAQDKNGTWSEVQKFKFEVKPTFLQSIKFKFLIFGILGLVLYLFFKRRFRLAQEKERTAAEISELKLQALRAQMNPHFIFNALTSIQYFFTKHDELTANKYMTNFADLVRQTLNSSRENFNTVNDEFDMLEKYISLELLRIDKPVNLSIDIDPQIDQDSVLVPSMMLQPIVENAILHGLKYSKHKSGVLSLKANQFKNRIEYIIEDNGPGVQSSVKTNKSAALDITYQRIKSINKIYGLEVQLVIKDFQELGFNTPGTRVTLSLNIHTKYE
ncbi:MAG: hypothetical protein COA58_13270 [Bacteroidetes bacterium]|nr:MAG: hypothetical protein COA58_13270 [Bacteroidota bacterium]